MTRSNPITITPVALEKIKALLEVRSSNALGLFVRIKSSGCNGLKYNIEYAESLPPKAIECEQDGVKLFIENKALMYLLGSKLDYIVTDKFKEGFEFINPNEKGRCGCGESFHV